MANYDKNSHVSRLENIRQYVWPFSMHLPDVSKLISRFVTCEDFIQM